MGEKCWHPGVECLSRLNDGTCKETVIERWTFCGYDLAGFQVENILRMKAKGEKMTDKRIMLNCHKRASRKMLKMRGVDLDALLVPGNKV